MTNAVTTKAGDDIIWHAVPAGEVAGRLSTDVNAGLDSAEADKRLRDHGPNRLPAGKKRGPFTRFLSQFNNILVYVLLGAGFVKLMLNLWVDAAIIFGVVILNALLGFLQEGKAEKALESIRNMLSAEARTMRGGETRMIGRACGKIDARAPGFVERVGRRVDHAGKSLDALQLPHRRGRQGRLDGRAQALVVDRAGEAARQPDGGLLEGHDLEAVATVTARRQAALPHGEAAVDDKGGSICACHDCLPPRNHLRFER